ncbi:hypothetical protein CBW65_09230 [Tumebacillus avium]|uniref:Uncharacterized protein n=1 Tax=Tumebacillus avium TaxID=1903704 RepID=A0A1Y0IL14_9BACL|nr:hypothetical protein [Tumebacillus avium]ARU61197.1 hypothetical protein CBW65_09230 [Tumebacillus avium]
MTVKMVGTFAEAAEVIKEMGVLPLSSFIPGHLSLEAITAKESWHTGLETDPWLWRDRFAGEGVAAYGRFFAKKPVLIDAGLFPLFQKAFGAARSAQQRYQDGLVSPAVPKIWQAIHDQPGIDVKALKKQVGMADKESKADFDKALIELQASFDVVIAGISEQLNEFGNKSGWNSTCYLLANRWLKLHGLQPSELSAEEAQEVLFQVLDGRLSADAMKYLRKVFKVK